MGALCIRLSVHPFITHARTPHQVQPSSQSINTNHQPTTNHQPGTAMAAASQSTPTTNQQPIPSATNLLALDPTAFAGRQCGCFAFHTLCLYPTAGFDRSFGLFGDAVRVHADLVRADAKTAQHLLVLPQALLPLQFIPMCGRACGCACECGVPGFR